MKKPALVAFAAVFALSAAKSASAAPLRLDLPIQKATLENGLRVVMNADKTSHSVAITLMVDVGSRDEAKGKTGLSRLVSDLTFGETKNLDRGELQKLVRSHSGFVSASARAGETVFGTQLPENALGLGLWLEAERLRHFAPSAESCELAKQRLMQEIARRSGYEKNQERLLGLVFQDSFPMAHPAYGSLFDIKKLSLEDVLAFQKRHYGPNRAVLALSGDFDPDSAMTLVHQYFDPIARTEASGAAPNALPEQNAERLTTMEETSADALTISYGYSIPHVQDPSFFPLSLLSIVLGDGEGSRLHSMLVSGKKALAEAVHVEIVPVDDRGGGLFQIEVVGKADAEPKEIETQLDNALASLREHPVSDAELRRAKAHFALQWLSPLENLSARAEALARYELHFGDARNLVRALDALDSVRADEVQTAAARWLAKSRVFVVKTRPYTTQSAGVGTSKAEKVR